MCILDISLFEDDYEDSGGDGEWNFLSCMAIMCAVLVFVKIRRSFCAVCRNSAILLVKCIECVGQPCPVEF